MKCPNCGNEMQDGHLICETCGYEIQIVPDFDPDVEVQIDKTIVEDNKFTESDAINQLGDDTLQDTVPIYSYIKNRAIFTVSVVAILFLMVAGVIFAIIKINSLDYQLEQINEYAAKGKYDKAIEKLENLYVHNPTYGDIFLLEADYYLKLNKTDQALDTLKRVIYDARFDETYVVKAYDKLIDIYSQTGDYKEIEKLLADCEYSEVVTAYQNYLAMPPVFSVDGGEYSEVIRLKLSANTSGKIYYTLDGSIPNLTSQEYTAPIMITESDCTVSAMFVNQYGIESEIVSQQYEILAVTPDAPVVNYDTGNYSKPLLIEVYVPEGISVYYTTDKSIPTIDSIPYIGVIPMPLNNSNFNFVAVNDQGLSSDVVVRSYNLSFPDGLSSAEAVSILKNRLVERGLLDDVSGKSSRAPGKYSYAASSAVSIEGQGDYYLIYELYTDEAGNTSSSDTTYIVEIHQGSTGILGGDAINGFIALAF